MAHLQFRGPLGWVSSAPLPSGSLEGLPGGSAHCCSDLRSVGSLWRPPPPLPLPLPPPPGGWEEKQGLEKEAGTIHRCAWPCSRQTQGSCPLTGHTLQDRMQQIGTSGGDKLLEKISGTRDRGGNGTPGCHTDGRGGVSRTLWPLARREIDGFTVVCRVEGGCWWQRLTWGEDENVNG